MRQTVGQSIGLHSETSSVLDTVAGPVRIWTRRFDVERTVYSDAGRVVRVVPSYEVVVTTAAEAVRARAEGRPPVQVVLDEATPGCPVWRNHLEAALWVMGFIEVTVAARINQLRRRAA